MMYCHCQVKNNKMYNSTTYDLIGVKSSTDDWRHEHSYSPPAANLKCSTSCQAHGYVPTAEEAVPRDLRPPISSNCDFKY